LIEAWLGKLRQGRSLEKRRPLAPSPDLLHTHAASC
jgi:hypothetical protein